MFSLVGRVIDSVSFAPLRKVAVSLCGAVELFANVPNTDEEGSPAAPIIAWTRQLTGFYGNRWQCWEQYVRGQVQGITWSEFCQRVLELNPVLIADGYVFRRAKTYLLPVNVPQSRLCLRTKTDSEGQYAFAGLDTPGEYELSLDLPGYNAYRELLYLSGDAEHNVALAAQEAQVVSNHTGYDQLPEKARKVIDQALSMLGDDQVVFDMLPPDLQRLCHGIYYLSDPNSIYYKDICCADLVTTCLHAAGLDYTWPADIATGGDYITPHAANYYRPWPGNPKLIELDLTSKWLPGDIVIYGNGDFATNRARHVNLYVGRFSGVDRRGRVLRYVDNHEVVNASIDWMAESTERGTGITALTLNYCINQRAGYDWCKRVRLEELERAYGSA